MLAGPHLRARRRRRQRLRRGQIRTASWTSRRPAGALHVSSSPTSPGRTPVCVWSTCEHGQNGVQDMFTGVHGISQQTLKIAFRYSSSIDAGIPLMCRSFLAGPPARAPADAAVLSRAPCLLVSSGASMLPCRMPALRKTAATWASRCFGLRAPAVRRCRQAVSMSALARAQAPRGEG